MRSNTSALVCSGGGALGIAHVGVLEVLEESAYQFDFLAGVSAGAIVTAGIACGLKSNQIWDIIKSVNIYALALDTPKTNYGMIQGQKVYEILETSFGDTHFEDLDMPLHIGCTDFETGERVMINTGKITDAVRGSLSIPVLFEPYFHPTLETYLADGGLTQNFPLDIALEKYEGDQIIGVDVTGVVPPLPDYTEKVLIGRTNRFKKMAERTFQIMFKAQRASFEDDPRVQIIEPELDDYSAMSLGSSNFEEIYKIGKTAGNEFLKNKNAH